MKISAIFGSLYYRPDYYRFKVRLNGDFKDHVFFADEEAGYVEVYRTHKGGVVTINDRPLVDRLFGQVQIEEEGNLLLL
jgi:hypothetical protein